MINKKRGFTLGETLIALGIIGVLAAILLPFALKAKPDYNKMMYLKAYDTLSGVVHNLVSNPSLFGYQVKHDGEEINCERLPFLDDSQPERGKYSGPSNTMFKGENKFCNFLAEGFGINREYTKCIEQPYSFNASNFDEQFTNNITFTLNNGMQWYVTYPQTTDINPDNNTATYQRDIYVDINGNKGKNCIYSQSCPKPDRFKFEVFADGELVPADPMGKMYIKTRKNPHKEYRTPKGTVNAGLNQRAIKNLGYRYIEVTIRIDIEPKSATEYKISDIRVGLREAKKGFNDTPDSDYIEITNSDVINSILSADSISITYSNNEKYHKGDSFNKNLTRKQINYTIDGMKEDTNCSDGGNDYDEDLENNMTKYKVHIVIF